MKVRDGWRHQNGWIFGKVPKGGWIIFNPKNYIADFGPLNRAFSAWKCNFQIQKGLFRVCFQPITMLNSCTTCISWEIGSYNTQQSHHNEHTHFCRNFVAKSAIWFSENEGGGQRPFGTFPKIHPFWRRRLSYKAFAGSHGRCRGLQFWMWAKTMVLRVQLQVGQNCSHTDYHQPG